MQIKEVEITRSIVERFISRFLDYIESDVAIVGAGPSGLTAAWKIAEKGLKTVVFERGLKPGGGLTGGGMMFSEIVVQQQALSVLEELGIGYHEQRPGYYVADALELLGALLVKVCRCGVKIFNLISVEDVLLIEQRVCGLVLNWSAVETAGLHVDPLTIATRVVVDATGHAAEVVNRLVRKAKITLATPTGGFVGEGPMWAERAEQLTLENTTEVYPGLWVTGMAANAVFGGPRMGPIFGGMLLSGQKVAQAIVQKLTSR
ncbi:MAG: sulfide-dependent adenosine diphosphate thiazole synthase [candidate division WOR-3 bacterium]|jgi:thiamine thiazole synthase